ncbi:uncharacterized protein METZ01_LOCUS168246, partial [marine metagenome]
VHQCWLLQALEGGCRERCPLLTQRRTLVVLLGDVCDIEPGIPVVLNQSRWQPRVEGQLVVREEADDGPDPHVLDFLDPLIDHFPADTCSFRVPRTGGLRELSC